VSPFEDARGAAERGRMTNKREPSRLRYQVASGIAEG
jgi:hypothetical protein